MFQAAGMSRYDIERFEPAPDPDLVCCICQSLLDEPLETPCRHVFCQVCIETWLNNRHSCPSCRQRISSNDLKQVMPLVKNMISRLLIKCVNYKNGCVKLIVLDQYEQHEKECTYEMLSCKYDKCAKQLLRKDRAMHETQECVYRELKCQKDCGLFLPISEYKGHNCMQALKNRINGTCNTQGRVGGGGWGWTW